MKILFVADGRSPIAINWMRFFVERGDDVYLSSTFACQPKLDLTGLYQAMDQGAWASMWYLFKNGMWPVSLKLTNFALDRL